jgi:hypothetical protein
VCLALGIDDPEQWLHEATERKLATWEAFFHVEPWGCDWERSAMQTQHICNTIAASHGVKKDNLYKLSDFMPSNWSGRKKAKQVNSKSIEDFQKYAKRFAK